MHTPFHHLCRSRKGIVLSWIAAVAVSLSPCGVLSFQPISRLDPPRSISRCMVFSEPLSSRKHTTQPTPRPTRIKLYDASKSSNIDGPDPSILISAQDDTTQRLAFVGAFAGLAIGTSICIQLWYGPGQTLLGGSENFDYIRQTIFPIAFGTIFAIVGILHFVFVNNFARIVPPNGTWGGIWQAPTPFRNALLPNVSYAEYHSYWTGIVELVGGLWLLLGGLGFTSSTTEPATLLFYLTIAVTPANLYMFTHDANPGGAIPRLSYPAGHIARFVVQCGLLSNFYIMSQP